MKSPRFLSVLLASGGLALAVSLPAQSIPGSGGSTPAPSATAGAANKSPVSNRPTTPNTPPHDPRVWTPSPLPNAPTDRTNSAGTTGSGLTPGAVNSGSGAGGRETVAPNSTPTTDPANARNRSSTVDGPGAHGFSTLDTDRDGRISQTEFSSPSASWLRSGAPGAAVGSDSMTGRASTSTNTAGPRDATGRPVAPGNSANVAGPHSAANNAQLFKELDLNHDGYLSAAEVEAYRAPTSLER